MRERPPGVEGERREHREHAALEVGDGGRALGFVELVEVVDVHAGLGELRHDLASPGVAGFVHELVGQRAAGDELLGGRHAVGRQVGDAGLDLLAQAGHADHEELAEVRAQDRQELDALEQRVALVADLFEHAALEGQHAELAVDVVGTVCEIDGRVDGRGRRRRFAGAFGCFAACVTWRVGGREAASRSRRPPTRPLPAIAAVRAASGRRRSGRRRSGRRRPGAAAAERLPPERLPPGRDAVALPACLCRLAERVRVGMRASPGAGAEGPL